MVNPKQIQSPLAFFEKTQNVEDEYIKMLGANKTTTTALNSANKSYAVSSVKLAAVKKNL